MPFARRSVLRGAAAAAAAASLVSRRARADDYPARPVRIVVGFPAGNASDIVGRLVAQKLQDRLGQPFIIENRPGAGGSIGADVVVKAAPDGYTLMLISPSATINPSLYPHLSFDFLRDIAPVAGVGLAPYVMAVTPSFPAKTVPELIAYAKANPGKLNMASAGNGSLSHLCGALFMTMAGVEMLHVPYRGSFLPDVLAGQVPVVFSPLSQSIGYFKGGQLRALAVTTKQRDPALPDVPTLGEFLPGYAAYGWYGIGAPRSTPAQILDRLAKSLAADLADPRTTAQLADIGAAPMALGPAEFGRFLAGETEKWRKVIHEANIKAG